jgi:N-acetylgalactosamine-N,N'-diacetylbacillosaminyl-diphospho-undecaprenol 4-alpha-N-acetylgalactosaminyltransferase
MKKNLSIFIYSLGSGGAERVVSILLNELKNKYNITLILMNDTIFYEIPENINVIFLENANAFENGIKKLLKLPFLSWKYSKIIKQNKIDISLSLLTRPNYINVISKLFNNQAKIIISERSFLSEEFKKLNFHSLVSKFLVRLIYKYADFAIAISKGSMVDLIKNFNFPKNKVEVIYNPIDLDYIKQNAVIIDNDTNLINFNKFTFITVGRLVSGKNHKQIIEAMHYLKNYNCQLLIIGDGEELRNLIKLVEKYKLKNYVIFLGKQKNPFKFLSKSNCFVFASQHESFGNVLLEALACELPVISTDCLSGPREILAPGTEYKNLNDIEIAEYGILTPINDVEKLAKAMKLMYENKELRYNFKNKVKIRAKDFEVNKIIKKWEKIIGD